MKILVSNPQRIATNDVD